METVKERLKEFIARDGISVRAFEKKCGLSSSFVGSISRGIGADKLALIQAAYPELSAAWLLTGEGEMLNAAPAPTNGKKIPFFEDVASIGGFSQVADVDSGAAVPSGWIDTGDWFPQATAAIRHYGDSMVEYPSGSILIIKRVEDWRLLINGRNYVLDTSEFRVTKQIQYDGGDCIMAYSSNPATYPDGRQIHSPVRVPLSSVRAIYLVIGCVTKEYSSGECAAEIK